MATLARPGASAPYSNIPITISALGITPERRGRILAAASLGASASAALKALPKYEGLYIFARKAR